MPIYLDGLNYFDALQASLDRVREAKDLMWHRTPIAVRQGLLAEIDAKRTQKETTRNEQK